MPVFNDQTGRTLTINEFPKRIISLVPSQTELLQYLGLENEVVGITKFCVHPNEWFRTKQRVGGTKDINTDTIHTLKPDLVIANKEENVKDQVEALAMNYPVWISDVNNLADAFEMIASIGHITGKAVEAAQLESDIKAAFQKLSPIKLPQTVCYLIWRSPYMTVGNDTFIHSMLEAAGFKNIFSDQARYPVVELEAIRNRNPDLIFLSSEPYPFRQPHADELQHYFPQAKIMLVDGESFSWYGSRLLQGPGYFLNLHAHGIY